MINATVIGAETVAARFLHMSPKMHVAMGRELTRLAIILQRYIKTQKLSGQVLNVKTGTLRRSIAYRIEDTGQQIDAIVGTKVKYGAAHEYGFQGPVTVKAHMRNITKAFGKSIKGTEVSVGSHSRMVNLPERSFLRSSLEDNRDLFNRELANATSRVIAGGE